MIFKKLNYPEANEIVVCTVKKVLPHSVFCNLDEYDLEGMIHISEIAPGRIRNMRDHVEEGRKIACKILSVDQEKGHINLSIRRVNQSQKIKKFQEFKQEEHSVKILLDALKDISKEDIQKIVEKIHEKYGSLTSCFNHIISGNLGLTSLNIDKQIAANLASIVKEKIKPPEVRIKAKLLLESTQPDGILSIKKILAAIKSINPNIQILYLGAPIYKLDIVSNDYKTAESYMKKITESTEALAKQLNCKAKFEKN